MIFLHTILLGNLEEVLTNKLFNLNIVIIIFINRFFINYKQRNC